MIGGTGDTKQIELRIVISALDRASQALNSISRELREISGETQKQGREGSRAWREQERSVNSYQQRLTDLQKEYRELSRQATRYWSTMKGMAAMFATLSGAMVLPVKAAADFERAMSKVVAVTTGASARYGELSEKAKALGRDTLYTAEQAAEGMKFLGMTGLNASEVIEAIGPALDLATLGAMDLAQAADYATNIMMGFELGVTDLTHVINVMAHAAANSNQTVTELANAMSYVAPIANAANVSLEATTASLGLLADRGIKASKAGTAMRGMIASLSSPTVQAASTMRELGVEIQKNADGTMDFIGTLEELNRAGMSSGDAFDIFRRTAAAAAQTLVSNVDSLREFTYEMTHGVEGAADRFRQLLEANLIGQLTKLRAALNQVMIELGEPFIRPITEAIEKMAEAANSAAEWIEENERIVVVVGRLVAALTAFVALGLGIATFMWANAKAAQAYKMALLGVLTITTKVSGSHGILAAALIATKAKWTANSRVIKGVTLLYTKLTGVVGALTLAFSYLASVVAAAGIGFLIGNWLNQFILVRDYAQRAIGYLHAFYHEVAAIFLRARLRVKEFGLSIYNLIPIVGGLIRTLNLLSSTSNEELEKALQHHKEMAALHYKTIESNKKLHEQERATNEERKNLAKEEKERQEELRKEIEASAKQRNQLAQESFETFNRFLQEGDRVVAGSTDFRLRLEEDLVNKKEELKRLEIAQQRTIEQEKGLQAQGAARERVEAKRQEIAQIEQLLEMDAVAYQEAEDRKSVYLEGSLRERISILQNQLAVSRVAYDEDVENLEAAEKRKLEAAKANREDTKAEIAKLETELNEVRSRKLQETHNIYAEANDERLEDFQRMLDREVLYTEEQNQRVLQAIKERYSAIKSEREVDLRELEDAYRDELYLITKMEDEKEITTEEAVQKRHVLEKEHNKRLALIYDELTQYAKTTFGETSEEYRAMLSLKTDHLRTFVNTANTLYTEMRDNFIDSMKDVQSELEKTLSESADRIRDLNTDIADRQMDLGDKIQDMRRRHMSEDERYQSYLAEATDKQREAQTRLNDLKRNAADLTQEEMDRQLELIRKFAEDSENAYDRYSRKSESALNTAIRGMTDVNRLLDETDEFEIDSFEKLKQGAEDALKTVAKWIDDFNRRAELDIDVNLTHIRHAANEINKLLAAMGKEEIKIDLDLPEADIKRVEDLFDEITTVPKKAEIKFDVTEPDLDEVVKVSTQRALEIAEAFNIPLDQAMNMTEVKEGLGELVDSFRDASGNVTEIWKQETGEWFEVIRDGTGRIIAAGDTVAYKIKEQKESTDDLGDSQSQVVRFQEALLKEQEESRKAAQRNSEEVEKMAGGYKKAKSEAETLATTISTAFSKKTEKPIEIVLENFSEIKSEIERWANTVTVKRVRVEQEKSMGGRVGAVGMAEGGRFPGNSKTDSIPVLARPGEGFVRNEALSVWDRLFGTGFFHGINDPWGSAGQSIINALKGNLSVSLPKIYQNTSPKTHYATGGRVSSPSSDQDMGKIVLEMGGREYPVQGKINVLEELRNDIAKQQRMRSNE